VATVVDALALAAGAAAAFNPCGIGLLPSYLAFLLDRPPPSSWPAAMLEGLGAGVAMTVGLLVPFGLLAATFGAVAGWVGPHLSTVGAILGLLVAAWGALLIVRPERAALSLALPVNVPRVRGRLGILVYGIVFALVSLGCTFPIFLSLMLQATTAGGALGGGVVVLLYGLGMGAVVTVLAIVARVAATAARRFTARAAAVAHRVAGVVVLLSGLFVAAYFAPGLPLP
jgi:cytochrome c biogenesis protein CcdA